MTNNELQANAAIHVEVRIEINEQALSSSKDVFSFTSIDKSFKHVIKNNSTDITAALSGGVTMGDKSAKATSSLSVSWKKITDVTESTELEKKYNSEAERTFQPGTTQIIAVKTTTYTFFGKSSTDTNRTSFAIGKISEPLDTRSDRYLTLEKQAWSNAMGVTKVPETKSMKFTFANIPIKRYTWENISRGDDIPEGAVYGGVFNRDGPCWVGRFNNVPGKINVTDGKMHNCWVQNLGSRTRAEILTTPFNTDWVDYKTGMYPPTNAVGDLNDGSDDLYVGMTNNREIGKINIYSSGKLCNLWTHSEGKNTSGKILVIDSSA